MYVTFFALKKAGHQQLKWPVENEKKKKKKKKKKTRYNFQVTLHESST